MALRCSSILVDINRRVDSVLLLVHQIPDCHRVQSIKPNFPVVASADADALSAFEIGMFLLLVWVPIVAAGSKDAFQWSETLVSWALMAGAWVVAESYRGMSWLVVNKR